MSIAVNTPPASESAQIEVIASYDVEFGLWLQDNPGGTFSAFSMSNVAAQLKRGHKHTTLGPRLVGKTNWRKHGFPFYRKLLRLAKPPQHARICDYGCGSLRIGVHFIKRQYAGCYFGLDVTRDFIDHGVRLSGDLIRTKRARVGTIRDDLDRAIDFDANILFTANVVCHIHPNEVEAFYSNIKRIVHRPEGTVVLHVVESGAMIRYQKSGWAWPLDFYDRQMEPFRRTRTDFVKRVVKGEHKLDTYILVYERPASSVSFIRKVRYFIKDKVAEYRRGKKRRSTKEG